MSKYEYIGAVLEFLIKKGPSSKYAISKGTAIPYPTILRKLPELEAAYIIQKVGEGKRGAEIYMMTPKGALIAYFGGHVRTSELFVALPAIMKHVRLSLDELPAVSNPLGFILTELPFKLSRLEDLKVEEAVSILGAILVWRHDEWYHEIKREKLKRLLSWEENYQILRLLIDSSINTLRKMSEQALRLSERADEFLSEIEGLREINFLFARKK
ncbi:MAG: hypothetical protein N2V75_03345 [Methanophagales archaeon]|nr:hypothetical protein [Methanophagales archaeon]